MSEMINAMPIGNENMTFSRESLIKSTKMSLHTKPVDNGQDFVLFEDKEYKFGILELEVLETPMINTQQIIDASIDMSGSMSDPCGDGRTKMQHSIHTLKNIINVLADSNGKEADTFISVVGFDDAIVNVMDLTKPTEDNMGELRQKIDNKLYPRNGTDLNLSLEKTKERTMKNAEEWPHKNLIQTNITMTDGLANKGNLSYSHMETQVPENSTNIFIGFGSDHDAVGLQRLAAKGAGNSYYYVDKIENAGIVFGEILHGILYKALRNVKISVENGEIYDFRTNTWSNLLIVESLTSEAKKTYHLRSKTPDDACVKIVGQSIVHGDLDDSMLVENEYFLPDLISEDTGEVHEVDLTKFMHRQKAQELVYKAHKLSTISRDEEINYLPKDIKEDLTKFSKYLDDYMKKNNLSEDEFYKTLYADIFITLRTFGTRRAAMYSGSRHVSQGQERSYNVCEIDEETNRHARMQPFPTPGRLNRTNAFAGFPGMEEDQDAFGEIPNLMLPPPVVRSRTTPSQMRLMREVSGGVVFVENEMRSPQISLINPADLQNSQDEILKTP